MAATRQGRRKRYLLELAWAVKLFARSPSCHGPMSATFARAVAIVCSRKKSAKNHWISWHCPFKIRSKYQEPVSHLIVMLTSCQHKTWCTFFTRQRVEISSLVDIVPFWFQFRINVHSLGTCFLPIHRWSRLQRIHGWIGLYSQRWWRKSPVLTVWSRVRPRRRKRRWCVHLRLRIPQCQPNQLRQAQHRAPQHSLRCVSSANAFHHHHGTRPQLLSSWLDSRVLWISNGGIQYTSKEKLHLHGSRDENTSWTFWRSSRKSVV